MYGHIKNGIEAIKKYYFRWRYQQYVARRISTLLGRKIDPDDITMAISLSYIFHDVGKIVEPFQGRIRKGRGAPGHEIISAYLTMMTLEEWQRLPELITRSITLAILLHMGAIRDLLNATEQLRRISHSFKLEAEVSREFNSIVEDCWFFNEIEPPLIPAKNLEFTTRDINRILIGRYIGKWIPLMRDIPYEERFKPKITTTILAFLILHPLLIADEYAVCQAVGREKMRRWASDFIRSLEEAQKRKHGKDFLQVPFYL